MHHFDFYRLLEAGLMRQEVAEVLEDPKAVAVIEWGDIVDDVLPVHRVTIHIAALSETQREITVNVPKDNEYLIPINT